MNHLLNAFRRVFYVQIEPQRLSVRDVKSGASMAEVPEMAIAQGRRATVLAVGDRAREAHALQPSLLINPFSHPRTLVGDFSVGQQLIKAFVQRLQSGSFVPLAPLVVLHPMGSPEGGFTEVELRAFREMALGAGASEVVLWTGRALADAEVLSEEVLRSES
jgi:rod shape-determining protein MreB